VGRGRRRAGIRRDDRGYRGKLIVALRWHLAWGAHAGWLQRLHEKEGGPLPKALADKPEVPPEMDLYWRAFDDLRGDRQIGMGGLGAIMWTSIAIYADRVGVAGQDAFERFVTVLKAMDAEYRDFVARQSPKR
jgi:hypothetical protein